MFYNLRYYYRFGIVCSFQNSSPYSCYWGNSTPGRESQAVFNLYSFPTYYSSTTRTYSNERPSGSRGSTLNPWPAATPSLSAILHYLFFFLCSCEKEEKGNLVLLNLVQIIKDHDRNFNENFMKPDFVEAMPADLLNQKDSLKNVRYLINELFLTTLWCLE